MAMFNEDKNLKSGGCADEIAALIRDDLSPKMIQEQLENYHNSDIAKSMEQMDRLGRMRLIRSIEPDKLAGIFKYVEPQEAAAFLKDIDTARAVFILEKIDPDAAAGGLLFTLVAAPVTLLARWLLEKFGPNVEF